MGTWKKMAEAFGRAVNSPTATTRGRSLVNKSETVRSAPGDVDPWTSERPSDLTPEQQAYLKGYDEGERINEATIADVGEDATDAGRAAEYRDKLEDSYTDRRLEKDARDEWDKAFAERKARVKDWYGDGYNQDAAQEGADAFEKALWDAVNEMKARGMSPQDILDRIKIKE